MKEKYFTIRISRKDAIMHAILDAVIYIVLFSIIVLCVISISNHNYEKQEYESNLEYYTQQVYAFCKLAEKNNIIPDDRKAPCEAYILDEDKVRLGYTSPDHTPNYIANYTPEYSELSN